MLRLPAIQVKEATRVYGDLAEKVAFTVDLNPVNIMASALGGYAATRTHDTITDKRMQEEASKKTLENDHYENIQNILRDMRIVFTPINVVYSVNGQVFEIIKTNEMSENMRQAFLAKDGEFFKRLLINKMNMELQLAEQVFAKGLIQQQLPPQYRSASHYSMKWMEKISFDTALSQLEVLEKKASSPIAFDFSLDAIRPFDAVPDFELIEKVANYFSHSNSETLSHRDLAANVKVGFLPDRVIFTYKGQLLEQISATHMNSAGYEAFRKRDKAFFMKFFLEESKRIEAAVVSESAGQTLDTLDKQAAPSDEKELSNELLSDFVMRLTGQKAMDAPFSKQAADEEETEDDSWVEAFADILQEAPSDGKETDEEVVDEDDAEEDDTEKTAASLEEKRSEWTESLSVEKENIDLWRDLDVHPIAYDWFLDTYYGDAWHETDHSALLAQLLSDFNLEEIHAIVADKLAFLQLVQSPKHSVYLSAFTFEKFMRVMNSKTVDFTEFEGGLEFEEILFSLDVAASVGEDDAFFLENGEGVSNHVARLLKDDGIRFISNQLYDEESEAERDFFEEVNGFLLRMWKEEDSRGLMGKEGEDARNKTVRINDIADTILRDYAEELDPKLPYDSADFIARNKQHLWHLSVEEQNAVVELVGRHVIATIFLELKQQELELMIDLLEKEAGDDE